MFPDEFHLNTLDQLLSAITRLNPHVNIKAIVIGLMDRLSSYAARESESEPQEDRKKTEEEAILRLLEKLKISKEAKEKTTKKDPTEAKAPNGERANGGESVERPSDNSEDQDPPQNESTTTEETEDEPILRKNRGIPGNVKLYSIFFDQVTNLVNAQRLHINDTMALLVSLTNLALYASLLLDRMDDRWLTSYAAVFTQND